MTRLLGPAVVGFAHRDQRDGLNAEVLLETSGGYDSTFGLSINDRAGLHSHVPARFVCTPKSLKSL